MARFMTAFFVFFSLVFFGCGPMCGYEDGCDEEPPCTGDVAVDMAGVQCVVGASPGPGDTIELSSELFLEEEVRMCAAPYCYPGPDCTQYTLWIGTNLPDVYGFEVFDGMDGELVLYETALVTQWGTSYAEFVYEDVGAYLIDVGMVFYDGVGKSDVEARIATIEFGYVSVEPNMYLEVVAVVPVLELEVDAWDISQCQNFVQNYYPAGT